MSVIPALPPAPATVSELFPIPVPLPHALALFFSRAAQGRSCFSLCLFSALYREALTLAGALITAVVQTINSRETKNYAARELQMSVCPFLDFLPLLSLPPGEWPHGFDKGRWIPPWWHRTQTLLLPSSPSPLVPGASEEIPAEIPWKWTRFFCPKQHSFDINPPVFRVHWEPDEVAHTISRLGEFSLHASSHGGWYVHATRPGSLSPPCM